MAENKEFRVGDRVFAKHNFVQHNARIRAGMQGEVVYVHPQKPHFVGVRWDEDVCGHTCDGCCQEGFGWYARMEDIEHIESFCEEFPEISEEEFLEVLV